MKDKEMTAELERVFEGDDQEGQDLPDKSDAFCSDWIHGPLDPVMVSARKVNRFGKDVEVDFQAVSEDDSMSVKSSLDSDLVKNVDEPCNADRQFLRDQYIAGVWAPHPEFFLSKEDGLDQDVSVFQKLKFNMELITDLPAEDRFIYKSIVQTGSGIPVENKQIVVVHYAAFIDYADEPVDVAYSRAMKRSFKLQVDNGNALPGFEMAIKSMTQGEEAIFIVSSSLAYGKRGCPPRYPGDAEIFYFIELISVLPNNQLELIMQLPAEERESLEFSTIRMVLRRCVRRVEFFYSQCEFRRAQAYQRWAIDLLEHCHVADEPDDKERLKLLLKAFLNGAVIAQKLSLPKSVMYHTGNALRMDRSNRKALFLRISALMDLQFRKEALPLCKRALQYYPKSETFAQLLTTIQINSENERQKERELYQRMLRGEPGKKLANAGEMNGTTTTASVVPAAIGNSANDSLERLTQLVLPLTSGATSSLSINIESITLDELKMLDQMVAELRIEMDIGESNTFVKLWQL